MYRYNVDFLRELRTEWMIRAAEAKLKGNLLSYQGWLEYCETAANVIEFLEGRL